MWPVYNSLENSEYSKMRKDSHLDELREKLLTFSESDLVLIGGDFNSRTGTLSDFVIEDERPSFFARKLRIRHPGEIMKIYL